MSELREPMVKLGVLPINSLQYGSPRLEQHFVMLEGCVLDQYIDEFKGLFPPENNSQRVKQEMSLVKEKMKSLGNSQLRNEYLSIDEDLRNYIGYYGGQKGVPDIVDWFDKMNKSTGSFLLKLKYFYQRPRPYQLASLFDIELYPLQSCSSLSPSYPSGHTFQAYMCEKYLEGLGVENNLSEIVARSRIALGLHYPSDNQGAFEIADEIIQKTEIKALFNE